ncbi:MAG: hypothetical protein R3261_13875, partial [Alphaproteobacteria bacterium]|nr:hypothetical protein [Alphaproteobacteria bacterium]
RATVVGIPAKVVSKSAKDAGFAPYGTPLGDLPDPVARAIEGLMDHVSSLNTQVRHLEERLSEAEKKGPMIGIDDAKVSDHKISAD